MPFNQSHDRSDLYAANYLAAHQQLGTLLKHRLLGDAQRQCSQNVMNQIEQLKKDGKLPITTATELLNDTRALLTNEMTAEAYKAKAQTVQGSPSSGLKILGALMITLGTLVTGLCITLAATIGITLSGEGVVGAGILAAGIGLFSGGVRSGLSLVMNELALHAKNQAPPVL